MVSLESIGISSGILLSLFQAILLSKSDSREDVSLLDSLQYADNPSSSKKEKKAMKETPNNEDEEISKFFKLVSTIIMTTMASFGSPSSSVLPSNTSLGDGRRSSQMTLEQTSLQDPKIAQNVRVSLLELVTRLITLDVANDDGSISFSKKSRSQASTRTNASTKVQ